MTTLQDVFPDGQPAKAGRDQAGPQKTNRPAKDFSARDDGMAQSDAQ